MTSLRSWLGSIALIFLVLIFYRAQAQPLTAFDLSTIRLERGPFFEAQRTDLHYILSLDVDRLLVPFLKDAGIPTTVKSYGNWENTGLDGHIGGHYLSALSLMYAATRNAEVKSRLDYMVSKLAECQHQNGNGYVGGIPDGKVVWTEIQQGKIDADNFSLNKRWVPLYNIHKLFAGLYDAATIGNNAQAKTVFVKLCDWFVDLTSKLSDEQIQLMLKSEHGGLNEVFAQATELTGDQKYLTLAKRVSHRFILDPLIKKTDQLTGLHANTQIPKVIGFAKIGQLMQDNSWTDAAEFFWKTVVDHRTVSIGGNSVREHFHPANDFSSMIESNQGPETCNTYNMLRLTKALYLSEPDVKYLDYYERAIYNHILSSQHPKGGFVYFTPMRPRHYRVYSSVNESFWCCVGSGIENHAKYGELIYARSGKDLYVNLFIPSTLQWQERGMELHQVTDFPFQENSTLKLRLKKKEKFKISVRHPAWVNAGEFRVTVNGKSVVADSHPSSYVAIDREWKDGDEIRIVIPMHTTIEKLPDGSSWAAFFHGPIVLAAATDSTDMKGLFADDSRMGHVAEGKFYPVEDAPVIVAKESTWLSDVREVPGQPLTFSLSSLVYPDKYRNLTLTPFFALHDKRYMLYWPIATPEQLEKFKADLTAKNKERDILKARTIDEVRFGEQQPEVEHKFDGEALEQGSTNGETWRVSRAWMTCELRHDGSKNAVLRIVTGREARSRHVDVSVNGQLLKDASEVTSSGGEMYVTEYRLPDEMTSGDKIQIRFMPKDQSGTGRVFSVALLRE